MEKQWMELHTYELDVLEMALRYFSTSKQCRTTKKDREVCRRIIDAISEKDEAYLVY